MGNTPSIEAQQRVPQKLSKPRVGNAVSGPSAGASSSTPGLHSSSIPKESIAAGSHNSNPARFSTFRPAPPPDLHPYAPAPSTLALSASHVDPALVDQSADRMASGTRERIRRSLFRSRSSQGRESTEDVAPRERRLSVGPRDPVTGHRLSRTNSLAAEHEGYASYMGRPATEDNWQALERRTSWNYDMNSYQAKRLLNMTEGSTAYEKYENTSIVSESKFDVVSAATWKSSHPTETPLASTATLTRANSDISLYAPVNRRRSMQTPGVATRNTRAVSSSRPPAANFRYSEPITPGQSRRNSMDFSPPGTSSSTVRVLSMPPRLPAAQDDSPKRAITPCDNDYKQIGAFKLGSLRITNGAASPGSPEAERTARRVEPPDHPPPPPPSQPQWLTGEDNHGGSQAASSRPISTEEIKPKAAAPAPQSPAPAVQTKVTVVEQPKPRRSLLSPITTSFLKLTGGRPENSSKVEELPKEFLAEIQFSPFSFEASRPSSPELLTTSKKGAVEDKLFDEESQADYLASVGSTSREVLDVRVDSHAKSSALNRPRPDSTRQQQVRRSVVRSDSGFISSPTSEYSHGSGTTHSHHKPLSKADSGYSSNQSLRSVTAAANAFKPPVPEKDVPRGRRRERDEPPPTPPKNNFLLGDLKLPSPTLGSLPFPPEPDEPPPPVPSKDPALSPAIAGLLPKSPTAPVVARHVALLAAPSGSDRRSGNGSRIRNTPSPINSSRSATDVSGGQQSPVDSLGPQSPATSDTSVSGVSSIDSISGIVARRNVSKPDKLDRLLGTSNYPKQGQLQHHHQHKHQHQHQQHQQHGGSLADATLHEKMGMHPLPTANRAGLRLEPSNHTLGTIFSVGSAMEQQHMHQQTVGEGGGDRRSIRGDSSGRPGSQIFDHQIVPGTPKLEAPERRHTFQSIMHRKPAVAATTSSSAKPETSHKKLRRVRSTNGGHTKQDVVESEAIQTDFEAEVTSYQYIRNSLGRGPLDHALMAAAFERGEYFSPTAAEPARTMSMRSVSSSSVHRPPERTNSHRSLEPAPLKLHPKRPADLQSGGERSPASSSVYSPTSTFHSQQSHDPFAPVATVPPPVRPAPTPPPMANNHPPRIIRRPESLRVPPPLAHGHNRPRSTSSHSMTHPADQERLQQQGSLSHRASRESVRSYQSTTASSPPPIPPMNPRRMSITGPPGPLGQPRNSMYFVPAQPWDNAEASVSSLSLSDEFEHELRRRQETQKRPQDYRQHENRQQEQSLSRRMSVDGTRSLSRRGSIVGSAGNGDEWYNNNTSAYHRTNSMSSSQHSDSAVSRSSSLSRRPSSAQGGHYRDSGGRSVYTTNQQRAYAQQQLHQQQMLRHRQSYDGHFYNMNQRYQNGPYPATSRDYYDPWLQQVYAGPYQPPYVPRSGSHYRNRSMGSSYYGWPGGGRQVPYRVLHSYNSPAYRNVPIWG